MFFKGLCVEKKRKKEAFEVLNCYRPLYIYGFIQIFIYDFDIRNEMYLVIIIGILGSKEVIAS